jgi:hypothetical protein
MTPIKTRIKQHRMFRINTFQIDLKSIQEFAPLIPRVLCNTSKIERWYFCFGVRAGLFGCFHRYAYADENGSWSACGVLGECEEGTELAPARSSVDLGLVDGDVVEIVESVFERCDSLAVYFKVDACESIVSNQE